MGTPFWVNVANAVLGAVTVLCCLPVAVALLLDIRDHHRARLAERRRKAPVTHSPQVRNAWRELIESHSRVH